jgi:dTDP-4-amino-4,6-dideoxygalactose transaminase
MPMIPFVDLNAQYQSIKSEIDKAIAECVDKSDFIKGDAVYDFELGFADYLGSDYCVSCGNGTDALEMILLALGVGPGDEVIVPALSWISTSECVNNVGADPVFVDINTDNFTIDTSKIEGKINTKTKGIIPVHLYGSPADIVEINRIAKKHNLFVVEDCAQAHGAEYAGKKVGTFGIASAFSFFPSKNLGAFGDAGAVITNDMSLAEKVRMISNHGQLNVKHSHKIIGRNSRLDTIQAAILNIKLKHLDNWNKLRIKCAMNYISGLKNVVGIIPPVVEKGKKHVFHLFVVKCKNRKNILASNQISSGIHYPKALPFLEAYKYKKHKREDFPSAFKLTEEILSLPIYPELSEDQIEMICNLIKENF